VREIAGSRALLYTTMVLLPAQAVNVLLDNDRQLLNLHWPVIIKATVCGDYVRATRKCDGGCQACGPGSIQTLV